MCLIQVNHGFDLLRTRVPKAVINKKLSKADTLREAVRYIQYLKSLLHTEEGMNQTGERVLHCLWHLLCFSVFLFSAALKSLIHLFPQVLLFFLQKGTRIAQERRETATFKKIPWFLLHLNPSSLSSILAGYTTPTCSGNNGFYNHSEMEFDVYFPTPTPSSATSQHPSPVHSMYSSTSAPQSENTGKSLFFQLRPNQPLTPIYSIIYILPYPFAFRWSSVRMMVP